LLLFVAFLRLNGVDLEVQPGQVAEMILQAATSPPAEHDDVIAGLAEWIAQRLRTEEGT
jgi:prophage maintenance system killer protein